LPATAERIPRRRWRIAWLLGLGVLVNYFDRVNLSVSYAALHVTFGISAVVFGNLASAYNWSYALCQLPVGVVLDRFGVKRVQRFGIFIWSMASFAAAITPNLPGFFAARLLLGVGEAPTFPANAKAIGVWFPPNERSFSTSLTDGAAKFASAIGVPLLGVLLLRAGWRWSFAATGVISLIYLLVFWVVYREPEEDSALTEAELQLIAARKENESPAANGFALSLGTLLRQPKVVGLSLGFGAYNYVFYLLLTWLPSYLSQALHIDLLHSFLYTGVPWLIATAADLFIGGMLVDALVSRGWNAPLVRKVVLVAGTACGLGILGAANARSASVALAWISLSIGGLSAAAPVGWSIPALITPRTSVGKVGGIVNFVCQVSGIAAQIVTGFIVKATDSYALAFGISAVYLLVGIAGYLFLLRRIEPMKIDAHLAAA
jgi:MFS transporter, ACS family, D-galactonate transporter